MEFGKKVEKLGAKTIEAVEKARTEAIVSAANYAWASDRESILKNWAGLLVRLGNRDEKVMRNLNNVVADFEKLGWDVEDIEVSVVPKPNFVELWFDAPSGKRERIRIATDTSEFTKEEFQTYKKLLDGPLGDLERFKGQMEAFKASPAYALYNNYYKDYLPDISKERYEELYNRLKNEVLSEEELKKVIEELEKLYEVAKFNKMGKELDNLKKENKELREELDELREQIELLREFIAEKHDAEEFIEWLREKDEEEEEDPYREKAEELVPELFEDEEDDDY